MKLKAISDSFALKRSTDEGCYSKTSVSVNQKIVNSIENGLCLLVGLGVDDNEDDLKWTVNKVLGLRLFDNWTKSVRDVDGEILSISQFTLQSTLKGTKPDFHKAMKTEEARKMYNNFLTSLKTSYFDNRIKDGIFAEMMDVNINNQGPITILIDSRKRK
ncbi:putative D-tyrosyl-tRNA deacylase [Wallemia mellicola]|nr:putative D-tyrosyl-tRNA deacylase [Wallemia mellicola]